MQNFTLLFLVFLGATTQVQAATITVSVSAKSELVLSGPDCSGLLKERTSLCLWKQSVQPEFIIPQYVKNTCVPVKKGIVKLAISECLPDFAKNYQKKKLINAGPNCWGTAMSFHKLSNTPRFMWPEEMQYWMESPLCRKLSIGEKRKPGDVINVYAPEKLDEKELTAKDPGSDFWEALYPNRYTAPQTVGYTGYHRLLHSVTYISDSLAFGKDSPAHDDRFYFHPMSEVYGRPGSVDPDCLENQALEPYIREYQKSPLKIKGSKCSYFSVAYRCENFNDYFSKNTKTKDLQEIWERVQTLQAKQDTLFPALTTILKISSADLKLMIAQADLSVKKANEGLKKPGLDKTYENLLVLEYFSAAGIRQSLEFANIIPSKNSQLK